MLYFLVLILLTVYSYSLVDLNLTLVNTPLWNTFRSFIIQVGYFKRDLSWAIYFFFISALFLFHILLVKNYEKANALQIASVVSVALVLSYPFLSHDFFNYMFDAKIVTLYHQNPYFFKPLDFPTDPWLRFMHWTHRTYPYGPVFLIFSLVPSVLSASKLFLAYIFFKGFFVLAYLTSVYYLTKINKRFGIIFATHPLVLIEGVVSSHNDLIAVALACIGTYYFLRKRNTQSFIFYLLSSGIKFITVPLLIVPIQLAALLKRQRISFPINTKLISFIGIVISILYIVKTGEIQPWYFLNLLIFIPFFEDLIQNFSLFFYGLLLSYYPFIRLGAWDSPDKVHLKHQIIFFAFIANLLLIWLKKTRTLPKTII